MGNGGGLRWSINPETGDFVCSGGDNSRELMYELSPEKVSTSYVFYYQKIKFEVIRQVLDITKNDKGNDVYEFIVRGIEIDNKALADPINQLPVDFTEFKQELEAAVLSYEMGLMNFGEKEENFETIDVAIYFKEDKSC